MEKIITELKKYILIYNIQRLKCNCQSLTAKEDALLNDFLDSFQTHANSSKTTV